MLHELVNILTSPFALFTAVWSMGLGIIMGALPGLSGPMAMAMLLGLTYGLSPQLAAMSLILIYMGGVYGGSQSAILLNIPGAAASAATALDGYPMAKKGLAGQAIGYVTFASFIGTLISIAMLWALTPILVRFSLLFAAWEMTLLALLGVVVAGSLSSEDPLKGWISGFIGLMFAMVGQDELHGFPRFAFGNTYLAAGIGLIPALVGLFGLSEVAMTLSADSAAAQSPPRSKLSGVIPPLTGLIKHARVMLQSGLIGTFVGILPGCGADIGGWLSYDAAKRTSSHPEEFGKGAVEGIVAVESGNNAVVPGSIIPVIALGIPGSGGAAIIMAALFLQGLKPGPLFLIENRALYDNMIVGMIIGAFLLLIMGLLLAHVMVLILRIPREDVMGVVLILAVIGAYGAHLRISDVWLMLGFGLLGYVLRRNNFSLAPMVLGIVLGEILDGNLRRALLVTQGSLTPFVTRPISLVLLLVLIAMTMMSLSAPRRALARLVSHLGGNSKSR
jgi:putative tricarboxylic transport membrane protein